MSPNISFSYYRRDYLQSPYLFMCCNLIHANEPNGEIVAPAHRALAGTVVSSLNRLKDVDNSDGGFFVFGDISARIEGRFRLRFTLFELVEGQVVHVMSIVSNPVIVHSSKTFPGMCESTFLSRSFSDQGVRIRIRKDHHVKPKKPVNDVPEDDDIEENSHSATAHSPPSSCHDDNQSDHDSSHDIQPSKGTNLSAPSASSSATTNSSSKPIPIGSRSRHHRTKSRYSSEEVLESSPPSSPGSYVTYGSAPSWGRHHPYRLDPSLRRYEDTRYTSSLQFRDPYYEHDRPSAFYEGLHLESNSRRFEHPGFVRPTLMHHPREIRGRQSEHGYPIEYGQRERSHSFGHPRYISASSIGYFHHPFDGHGPYWVEGPPVYLRGTEQPPPHAIAVVHPTTAAFVSPHGSSLIRAASSSKKIKVQASTHSARHGFPAALLNDEEMADVTESANDKHQTNISHSRTPSMSSQHSEYNFSPPHSFSPSESHGPIASLDYRPRLQSPNSPHSHGHQANAPSISSFSSAGGDERIHLPPIHTLSTHSPVPSLKPLASFSTRTFS
ncbi:hypothetical protein FBU30_006498 [Linnemannia zychae]|nr:hypothetical protein FBU30_006498 [Linnemannia zychae]